jgi:exonuclease 3'-5' domain-containing protein 1
MERPISPHLLQYAANDIRLIAHLLAIFDTLGFFSLDVAALAARSERYVARRERVRVDDPLRPCALLMLDALGTIRCGGACTRCGKDLPVSCFERWRGKGVEMRRSHCRLCVVVTRRAGVEVAWGWIKVPVQPRARYVPAQPYALCGVLMSGGTVRGTGRAH